MWRSAEVIKNNVTGFIVKKIIQLCLQTKFRFNLYKKLKKFSINSYKDFKKRFSHIKMIKSYNNLIKYNSVAKL